MREILGSVVFKEFKELTVPREDVVPLDKREQQVQLVKVDHVDVTEIQV